jgi:hypothetical protein
MGGYRFVDLDGIIMPARDRGPARSDGLGIGGGGSTRTTVEDCSDLARRRGMPSENP